MVSSYILLTEPASTRFGIWRVGQALCLSFGLSETILGAPSFLRFVQKGWGF
jgi:hypothetical protein